MNKRAEIGGEMAVDYWGKGIALEAVEAILKFGFEELKLHTIEAKVSPENKGAIHVLEYLGFQKEAHFKDRIYFKEHYLDMAIYTLFEK
jgi:ribosomal-protein-alanine N-acetyltransferase